MRNSRSSTLHLKVNMPKLATSNKEEGVMDRLQTSGELQDKTSFIDPSTGVDPLKSCSPDYLLL
jgi:hypothetical protein